MTYAPNLDLGDSVFNITNTSAADGNICENVYAFSPDEQMIACCSCPVTPNGLVSLSAREDLLPNVLTLGSPSALLVKFFASKQVGASCASSSVTPDRRLPARSVGAPESTITVFVS